MYNGTDSYVGKIGVSLHKQFKRLLDSYEFIENSHIKDENLNLSSYFFPLGHKFHHIGQRANWDGLSFDVSSLKIKKFQGVLSDFINELSVGFRCYKELH